VTSPALIEKFGRTYEEGDIIFCEFEEGNECFVIHSGEVSIVKISEGLEKVLALLKPGDIFGEMGVLEKKPRTATAIALTELTVLALDLKGLQSMVQAQPQFAFQLGRILGQRIVQSYRHLTNLAIESPRLRVLDMLLWKMEPAKDPGEPPITPFSPQEIADFVGVSMADVDKVLQEFIALGRIRTYSDRIEILDLRSLKRLIKPAG
jgi:CRP-like cAMP-binding protein